MSSQLQVSGEAKIRDIQGPVVANSGVITALDGAASQYVRGVATLADFPTSSGGGSSVSYYLNSSVSQGTIGGVAYRELNKEPIIGAGTDIAISTTGYVASYLTDANDPDVLSIPGGNFNCEFYFSVSNDTGNPFFYAELYKYDGTTFTLLGSSVGVPEYINQGTIIAPYYFAIPVATAALALTDRLAIRIYVNVDGRTVTLHTENGHLCQVVTTLSKGMVSLNNLTDQSQFLTTGTSGTDFTIASTGDTHTFNLPIASAANTGKLSSTDWSTFNAKQATISLTTTGTSGAATLVGATLNIPQYQGVLTNPVTGTGTTNTLPKFIGTSAIGNSNITDTGSLITLSSNSLINGNVGIGSTPTTTIGLLISRNITGAVTSYGTYSNGSIQSDVTTNATYHATFIGTAAASFTVNNAYGHYVAQTTIGAGSAISTQQAFYAHSNFTGATNNYGFRGSIPAAANRWNIYMDGTANNYMAGSLGIGTTSFVFGGGTYNLNLTKNITGTVVAGAMNIGSIVQSDVTSAAIGLNVQVTTAAAAFTLNQLRHISVNQTTLGAGSSVSNQYGIYVDQITNGSSNFGFFGNIPAGTNRWNIYMAGTANNYIAGSLGIGSVGLSTYSLRVAKSLTGATTMIGISSEGTIQSDVTTGAIAYISALSTAAAAFTLNNYYHFYMQQGSIGAGSAITNQFGLFVDSTLVGATNNYGVFLGIPSGTGRWNLYASGTANNYLAGSLGIGSTSIDTTMLRISRSFSSTITGAIYLDSLISSTGTGQMNYITTVAQTAAASFTVGAIRHININQGTFGAGSTVSDQYGVIINSNFVGATNNYGFFGNIPSGTNRWNLYMAGTAANYMAGDLGIGAIPGGARKLEIGLNDATTYTTTTLSNGLSITNTSATTNSFAGIFLSANPTTGNAARASINVIAISGGTGDLTFTTRNASVQAEKIRIKAQGQMRFVPLASDPSGAEAGDVYYNGNSSKRL